MDPLAIADLLARVNWDMVIGLTLIPVFLGTAAAFIFPEKHWPWDPQYRGVALGGGSLFLATSLGTGLSGIGDTAWAVLVWSILLYAIYSAYQTVQWWVGHQPIRGMEYTLKGVGQVTVVHVNRSLDPLAATVEVALEDGSTTTMSTWTLLTAGKRVEPSAAAAAPTPTPIDPLALDDIDLERGKPGVSTQKGGWASRQRQKI